MPLLAIVQARDCTLSDALETVERVLQTKPELLFRPEALRLRGELRIKLRQSELVEADFRQAIALARKMGAKALELHSTTSLARLLAQQGWRYEARPMLAKITAGSPKAPIPPI